MQPKHMQVCGESWRYHTEIGAWSEGPPLCTPRYAAASTTCGHQLIIAGGQDNASVLADTETLDPERGWLQAPQLNHARKYHGLTCVNKRIFCIGGKGPLGQRLRSVEALDLREGRWRRVAELPQPQSSFGCAALGGRVYVAGGNDAGGEPGCEVLAFSPLMERWQCCAPLPWCCNSLGLCAA